MNSNHPYSIEWWIDEAFYYARYPDVAASDMSAAEHYLTYGWQEGRAPSSGFDPVRENDARPHRWAPRSNGRFWLALSPAATRTTGDTTRLS